MSNKYKSAKYNKIRKEKARKKRNQSDKNKGLDLLWAVRTLIKSIEDEGGLTGLRLFALEQDIPFETVYRDSDLTDEEDKKRLKKILLNKFKKREKHE